MDLDPSQPSSADQTPQAEQPDLASLPVDLGTAPNTDTCLDRQCPEVLRIDPDGAFLRPLMTLCYAHGSVRRDDDSALIMVPELNHGMSLDEFRVLKSAGELKTTMMVCDQCRVLMEVNHTEGFDFRNMSSCPCCNETRWSQTAETHGFTSGLAAPRIRP